MKNPYKRTDIFRCKYHAHAKFDYKVSVYHVLRVKKCYPQGCLSFQWKCELLQKGKSCVKGYNYVGKNCFGCRYYYDEKINLHPELQISEEAYLGFLDELEDFEDWLESIQGKFINFWGTIRSVKPKITKTIDNDKSSVHLDGYILHFEEGYLDTTHWADHCYALIFAEQQERYTFAPGDDVEFRCRAELDRGRLILRRLRDVEFRSKSQTESWSNSTALVARIAAVPFDTQPERCLHCDKGVLVDVLDKTNSHWERRRELYCLDAIQDPALCSRNIETIEDELEEECP